MPFSNSKYAQFAAQKMKFSIKDFFGADLVTFTEEILYRKLLFLCAVPCSLRFAFSKKITRKIDKNYIKYKSSFAQFSL